MSTGKSVFIAFFALIMMAVTAYFIFMYAARVNSKNSDDPIRIGITLTGDSIPAIIAIEKGFFKEEGLTPIISDYPYGAISLKNLLDNNIDLAMLAETPLIVQSFNRKDFVVIANISSTYQARKIVALTSKGIHSIKDLRGKRVGVLKNTSAHYFLEELLLENQIPLQDVQIVFIGEDESNEALKDGRVDAISAFEPYPEFIKEKWPSNSLWVNDGDGRVRTAFSYVMTRDYLSAHKEVAKKAIRATVKAIEWMNMHPDEAISISAKVLKIDPNIMKNLYGQYHFGVGLDEAFLLGMQQQAQWYLTSNQAMKDQKIPGYINFVDPTALFEVLPASVNYAH